jgi:hypothetical protein
MITRTKLGWPNLRRRLRKGGVQHVITVTYVSTDDSPTGAGYRIEGPVSNGDWRRTSWTDFGKRMTSVNNRNLCRRLERLEQRMAPTMVRKVWQIKILNPDGTYLDGGTIEWPAPKPAESFGPAVPASRRPYR